MALHESQLYHLVARNLFPGEKRPPYAKMIDAATVNPDCGEVESYHAHATLRTGLKRRISLPPSFL